MATKKSRVELICGILKRKKIAENGCLNLNINLDNGDRINWVGYRQICYAKRDPKYTNVFRLQRIGLRTSRMTAKLLDEIIAEIILI